MEKIGNGGETPNQQYEETANVLNPENIEFAGDKGEKFPDVKVADGHYAWEMTDECAAVNKWLNNMTNEDGSWKYDNVVVPEEWKEYTEDALAARRIEYAEKNKEIEWIKNSKNIDFSLENNSKVRKEYSELSDDRKEAIERDKQQLLDAANPFLEETNSMERIIGLANLVKIPMETFVAKYGDVISDSTIDIVKKHIQKIAGDASSSYPDDGKIRTRGEYADGDVNFINTLEKEARNLSDAINVADFSGDDRMIDAYMDVGGKHTLFRHYAQGHIINNERAVAYVQNVVPLIKQRDPEVERLWNNPYDIFAAYPSLGEFRIGDFCIYALTSRVNPANTQELLLAYMDVTTDNAAVHEQNRNDGFELEGNLIKYRGFIHRELPGEHEILSSMLKFYDTKDNPDEHREAEAELQKIYDEYATYGLSERMFDLNNYEKEEERRNERDRTGVKEKVVDALRRLVKNTEPKVLEKPKTSDAQLNDLIQKMHLDINERSGEAYVDFKEVGNIVKRMNELLKERQDTVGMKPSEVRSIAFVERIATFAMRGIDEKDRRELPFDPNFKEICRFAELTSQSGKYNESDFESFWRKFEWIKDFENEDEIAEHYQMLSARRLAQLRELPSKTSFLKRKAEALWSGNLNNELLGLIDKRN